jgi:protein-S-isoprenylcysteine O-methyltransferase Ste14
MNLDQKLFFVILAGLVVAMGIFVALLFIRVPYGRHLRPGWGPLITNMLGWIIMESPGALVFMVCFICGGVKKTLPLVIFFVLWEMHYIHRTFIYPLTIRDGRKKMPVAVMLMGFCFNLGNAFVNGNYLFNRSGGYAGTWLLDPRFIAGIALFLVGFIVNRWADLVLRRLRKPGETGYRIPYGGLFLLISCPNYLGEIVEWTGWALMTWSFPGLAFAIWTFANLAPRARSNHKWYHSTFPEYPAERKALIPWIW